MPKSPIALVGPTASGKSALAMTIAGHLGNAEIVSVDSMQVYRGMDIGTAKPSMADQQSVPHHMIDLVEPDEEFSLSQFQAQALAVIAAIEDRKNVPLLVGGTGLYMQAITDGFTLPGQFPDARAEIEKEEDTHRLHERLVGSDPEAAARIEPDNRRRILRALEVTVGSGRKFSSFGPGIGAYPPNRFRMIGLQMTPEVNAERIEQRVDRMFANGLVHEVHELKEKYEFAKTARQALGYKEILDNLANYNEAVVNDEIKRRTRSFARRQRVWFRRDPRIEFFNAENDVEQLVEQILS